MTVINKNAFRVAVDAISNDGLATKAVAEKCAHLAISTYLKEMCLYDNGLAENELSELPRAAINHEVCDCCAGVAEEWERLSIAGLNVTSMTEQERGLAAKVAAAIAKAIRDEYGVSPGLTSSLSAHMS